MTACKKLLSLTSIAAFVLVVLFSGSPAYAVDCESVPAGGDYQIDTEGACTFTYDIDGVDSGTGSTNTAVLTVTTGGALTVRAGQTLASGTISVTGTGTITIVDTGSFKTGQPLYVTDADGDGYASYGTTQALTGTTRRNTLTSITSFDCGPSDANAKPGQTTYYTTSFNNTQSGDSTSFDWNCDGSETKQYTAIYSCDACTNGSGYGSFDANSTSGTEGWLTSAPACGVAANNYTISNSTCKDPAVADCSAAASAASRTESCR